MNVYRIPFKAQRVMPVPNGELRASELARLDASINHIINAGKYVSLFPFFLPLFSSPHSRFVSLLYLFCFHLHSFNFLFIDMLFWILTGTDRCGALLWQEIVPNQLLPTFGENWLPIISPIPRYLLPASLFSIISFPTSIFVILSPFLHLSKCYLGYFWTYERAARSRCHALDVRSSGRHSLPLLFFFFSIVVFFDIVHLWRYELILFGQFSENVFFLIQILGSDKRNQECWRYATHLGSWCLLDWRPLVCFVSFLYCFSLLYLFFCSNITQ